jgi:hypothetical protein
MAQVAKCLSSKQETLSLNPSTIKENQIEELWGLHLSTYDLCLSNVTYSGKNISLIFREVKFFPTVTK